MKRKTLVRLGIMSGVLLIVFLLFSVSAKAVQLDDADRKPHLPADEEEIKLPDFAPGQVIIRLKENENVEDLFNKKYSQRKAKHNTKVSRIKNQYGLRSEKPVFSYLHKQLKKHNLTQLEYREKIRAKSRRKKRILENEKK